MDWKLLKRYSAEVVLQEGSEPETLFVLAPSEDAAQRAFENEVKRRKEKKNDK